MKRKRTTKPPKLDKEAQSLALEILSSDSFLVVNKKLLSQFGPEKAVYIGNLVDKYKYFQQAGKLGKDGSFFLTHEDQYKHTGMTPYALRKCKAELKKMGVLHTEMKGAPAKEFYILNLTELLNMFRTTRRIEFDDARPIEFDDARPIEFDDAYKENKYKENKYKELNSSLDEEEAKKEKETEFMEKVDSIFNEHQGTGQIFPLQEGPVPDSLKPITESLFEEFWAIYPKKVDKGKAKTKWTTISKRPIKDRPTWKQIKDSIEAQKETDRWKNKQFIPHPTTWLNQQRWLDDPAEMNDHYSKGSAPTSKTDSASKNQESPRKFIYQHFQSKDMAKAFHGACFIPALSLLGGKEGIDSFFLAETLVTLYEAVQENQERNFTDKRLHSLLPGPMELIENYIAWIEENDWVHDRRVEMFRIGHGLFTKFCREEAKKDNSERNPLTGRSYRT